MIPDSIREFLKRPRFATVASVGRDLRPHVHRTMGGALQGNTALFLVSPGTVDILAEDLAAHPRVAVVFGAIDAFEAYQVKGTGRIRDATSEELQRATANFIELGALVEKTTGIPARLYEQITTHGAIALEVTVDASFAQSPGADAGKRLGGAA